MQTKNLRLVLELDVTVEGESLDYSNDVYVKAYIDAFKKKINSTATGLGFTSILTSVEPTVIDLDELLGGKK